MALGWLAWQEARGDRRPSRAACQRLDPPPTNERRSTTCGVKAALDLGWGRSGESARVERTLCCKTVSFATMALMLFGTSSPTELSRPLEASRAHDRGRLLAPQAVPVSRQRARGGLRVSVWQWTLHAAIVELA